MGDSILNDEGSPHRLSPAHCGHRRLMSDESLESQKAILVGGLCPGAEDVAQCEANLPDAIVGEITPAICEGNPTEQCPAAVDGVIRQGLPMLAAAGDDSGSAQACNAAVEGTCPARKFRLFRGRMNRRNRF